MVLYWLRKYDFLQEPLYVLLSKAMQIVSPEIGLLRSTLQYTHSTVKYSTVPDSTHE
jgi:hypothetical protein